MSTLAERLAAARGDAPVAAPRPGAAEPAATDGATSRAPAQTGSPTEAPPAPAPRAAPEPPSAARPARAEPASLGTVDALQRVKQEAAQALFSRIGSRLSDPTLSEEQLQALVRDELNAVVAEQQAPLTAQERQRLISEVRDDVLGLGPLQRLLDDPTITEIMVNGPDKVYAEQGGKLARTAVRFASEDQLRRIIERIVSRIGRRIDESSPMVDARLEDGSRVNAVIPPLAFSGSTLTIRKFAKDPFKVPDLIRFGTLTPQMAALLQACVEGKLNIIVSGGTGSGKTTLLNVLSSFIPERDRILTIEDAVELQLQQDHVVRLESRPANIEGKGEVTIRDLVRNSLRMRPDRIVVGEVRGGETLDMLQAMNTGHDGSLSTVHSNSPRDAIARLETLVLMAGMDLPLRAIREQIASAVDLIVQLTRLRDGTRRITAVTEVQGMEGQTVTLQDVFLFDYAAGVDAAGRFIGVPTATGVRPKFTERFDDLGIALPAGIFDVEPRR